MGVSNLRQSTRRNNNGDYLLSSLNTNKITIDTVQERTAEVLCDSYPYEGQSIYYGDLIYHEESEIGRSRDISCKFEYRSESGLFILQSEVDLHLEEIIKEINTKSNTDFKIYHTLSPGRESLWEFIRNATRIIEVNFLRQENEELDIAEIPDESLDTVANEYPIESASAVYEHSSQQILVRYSNGSIKIDTEDIEAYEYIIQLFEKDVVHREE